MLKPGLSEIYGAVTGVIAEGVTLSKKGVAIMAHPLTEKAYEASEKLFDAQYALGRGAKTQDAVAGRLIQFLQSALPTLDQYAALGKTAEVRDHVRDLLSREESGEGRSVERFKEGGNPAKPYKAPESGKGSAPALSA